MIHTHSPNQWICWTSDEPFAHMNARAHNDRQTERMREREVTTIKKNQYSMGKSVHADTLASHTYVVL